MDFSRPSLRCREKHFANKTVVSNGFKMALNNGQLRGSNPGLQKFPVLNKLRKLMGIFTLFHHPNDGGFTTHFLTVFVTGLF